MTRIAGLDIDNMSSVDAMEHARTLTFAVIWTRGDRLANERSYAEEASRAIAHEVMQRGMVELKPEPEPKAKSPAASMAELAKELHESATETLRAVDSNMGGIPEIVRIAARECISDRKMRAREYGHLAMQMGMR